MRKGKLHSECCGLKINCDGRDRGDLGSVKVDLCHLAELETENHGAFEVVYKLDLIVRSNNRFKILRLESPDLR
jgi:hypothetical protein